MNKKISKIFKVGIADNKQLFIPIETFEKISLSNIPVFVIDESNQKEFYYDNGYFNFKEHYRSPDGYIPENYIVTQDGDYIVSDVVLFSNKDILGDFVNYEIEVLDYEQKDDVSHIKDMNVKVIYIK